MRDLSNAASAAALLICLSMMTPLQAEDAPAATPGKETTGKQTTLQTVESAPSVTILGSKQAQGVLGKEVRSTANENMGRIVDIIVDRNGQVRAAIIDFGGFLGVGSRKIAVDWNALRFPEAGSGKSEIITLELTRDKLKGAPEYKDKSAVIVLGASGGLSALPNE
jgi:hypothetical protein